MGRKANPVVIGLFVLFAIALALVGVLVFGSGQLFKDTTQYVMFFTGDVNGLSVGAPVKIKGVEIGSVTDIRLGLGGMSSISAAKSADQIRIPVKVEVDNAKVVQRGGSRQGTDRQRLDELVKLGLRAQLQSQSYVTGLLFIQLDFHPEIPATLILPPDAEELEVPTIPSALEQVQSAAQVILKKIEDMRIDEMIHNANEALKGINKLANSPSLQQFLDDLPKLAADLDGAVADVRKLVDDVDARQGPLLANLTESSAELDRTLKDLRLVVGKADTLIDPNSPLAAKLTSALNEFAEAARSVRLLADFLERNPGALLRGREVPNK